MGRRCRHCATAFSARAGRAEKQCLWLGCLPFLASLLLWSPRQLGYSERPTAIPLRRGGGGEQAGLGICDLFLASSACFSSL